MQRRRSALAIGTVIAVTAAMAACTTAPDAPSRRRAAQRHAHRRPLGFPRARLRRADAGDHEGVRGRQPERDHRHARDRSCRLRDEAEDPVLLGWRTGRLHDGGHILPRARGGGLLVPLDGVLDEDLVATLNNTNNAAIWDDQRLAVTWQVAPYAFLWNKDLLAAAGVEAPTTPEELLEAAKTIHEQARDRRVRRAPPPRGGDPVVDRLQQLGGRLRRRLVEGWPAHHREPREHRGGDLLQGDVRLRRVRGR